MTELGPLLAADETFTHQIADTFATVGQADRSWTEKVCAMACARDGSLQVHFGMGKYPNRNVLDAYAGVSRGKEQWTVRASRHLAPEPERSSVGPIDYEIVDPLHTIRFALGPNDVVPVSFEWFFAGAVPPALEHREQHRSRDGYRLDADIVRFHHIGVARGWVDVDGERTEFDEVTWVSTRDRSWGVRYMVGEPPADLAPRPEVPDVSTTVMWAPILCERPDGSRYGVHWYYQRHRFGDWQRIELQGGIEHADGRREPFAALVPELRVDPDNRRLLRGTLHCTMSDGSERPIHIEALGDTGFHLGAGLYFGFDGHWHGQDRGRLHVDGEYIADCTEPAAARRLHQLRDTVVRLEDPTVGGVGWGNVQPMFLGPHEDLGLTAATSFM
jgi:hypothetical protein